MLNYLYNLATDKYNGFIPSCVKFFLFILSLIYGFIVRILIFVYGFVRFRPDCKVISVGNITLGGTGKTPLVEYIGRYLKTQGHKVAIVSRGYKTGDEPRMLEKNLKNIPVIVDADRKRAIKRALGDYGIDTVILDDGLQQWKIKKDIEIVVIDAANPFGNGQMLPRGILRQPLSTLRCADIFVFSKTGLNPGIQNAKVFLQRINPAALSAESRHQPLGFYDPAEEEKLLNPDMLKGKTVTLFSAIGDPGSFEDSISKMGINIGLVFRFPDHHNYLKDDLDRIFKNSKENNIDTIITTEKDAVKLGGLKAPAYGLRVLALRIELRITENEEGFRNRLLGVYSR